MRGQLRGDRGQVATAVMIIVAVAVTAVVTLGVLPLGAASNEKGQSQTAADAAALAGAEAVRDRLVEGIGRVNGIGPSGVPSVVETLNDVFSCGFGRDQAAALASRNGADLVSYSWCGDRVDAAVQNVRSSGGAPARSRAAADLGIRLDECRLDGLPEPHPDPTPTPTVSEDPEDPPPSSPPPEPPPDLDLELRCGDLAVDVRLLGATGVLELRADLARLRDRLEPRLVA